MYKIAIPKPCFESWEQMKPDGNGRYCSSCAKTVIDFSVMSDEEVQQYFTSNYSNKICGHFKNVQLQRIEIDLPQNILSIRLPFWKRFLVILLMSYGGSFTGIDISLAKNSSYTQGKPVISYKATNKTGSKNKQKKKQPRKRRKNKQIAELEYPFILTTLGLINTKPVNPGISLNPDTLITKQEARLKLKNNDGDYMEVADPGGNKPAVPEPLPEKTAFILPGTAAGQKTIFSKKKK